MDNLFLIVRIAGQKVAIDAERVSAVVEVERVTPVPCVPPHVAGLFALRSRVLTVIDAQAAVGCPPLDLAGPAVGVIVTLDGHGYALLVEDVADVVAAPAPEPAGAVLGPTWARVARGRITTAEGEMLLVDAGALVLAEDVSIAA